MIFANIIKLQTKFNNSLNILGIRISSKINKTPFRLLKAENGVLIIQYCYLAYQTDFYLLPVMMRSLISHWSAPAGLAPYLNATWIFFPA